eukprot:2655317-Rhodomonas_salina.3
MQANRVDKGQPKDQTQGAGDFRHRAPSVICSIMMTVLYIRCEMTSADILGYAGTRDELYARGPSETEQRADFAVHLSQAGQHRGILTGPPPAEDDQRRGRNWSV